MPLTLTHPEGPADFFLQAPRLEPVDLDALYAAPSPAGFGTDAGRQERRGCQAGAVLMSTINSEGETS